jgi:hypothetical protein
MRGEIENRENKIPAKVQSTAALPYYDLVGPIPSDALRSTRNHI